MVAWGDNGSGQTAIPVGLSGVTAIAAGGNHSVALKSDGTLAYWGDNLAGLATVPASATGVTAIATGFTHLMALRNDGTVVVWGTANGPNRVATIPGVWSDVTAVAPSTGHALALHSDGTVTAWGRNDAGQATVPSTAVGVTAIAVGDNHSVALKNNQTVVAWGSNSKNQSILPGGLSGVIAIAAAADHTLALKSDGTVIGWGDPTNTLLTVPLGLSNVVAIATASDHSVVLKNDGTVVVWGDNSSGQLAVPAGLIHVTAIAAGTGHTVALRSDGSAVGWPTADWGSIALPALNGIAAIAARGKHYAALKSTGTVLTWGDGLAVGSSTVQEITMGDDALWTRVPTRQANALTISSTALGADGTPHTPLITTANGLIPTSTTYDGARVPPTAIGTYAVVSEADYLGSYGSASGTLTLKTAQHITFTPIPSQTVGAPPVTLSATSSAGLPVTFSVISGPGSISGSGTLLIFTGGGTVVVAADQVGDTIYAAAPQVTQLVTVGRTAQTITFPALADVTFHVPPPPLTVTLHATASSTLPVTYRIVHGPATLNSGVLTIISSGTIEITANQAGDSTYDAAPQVTRTLLVKADSSAPGTLGSDDDGDDSSKKCGLGGGGVALLLGGWLVAARLRRQRAG